MKVYNYLILMMTFVIVLQFLGFETGLSESINSVMGFNITTNSTTGESDIVVTQTSLYDRIFDAITGELILATLGGIAIAFAFRLTGENFIILPVITNVLTIFTQTFYSIIQYSIGLGNDWLAMIMVVILLPLAVGFTFSLLEFFRGTD